MLLRRVEIRDGALLFMLTCVLKKSVSCCCPCHLIHDKHITFTLIFFKNVKVFAEIIGDAHAAIKISQRDGCALCPVSPSGNILGSPSIIQYLARILTLIRPTDLIQISSVLLVLLCTGVCRHVCTHILIFS